MTLKKALNEINEYSFKTKSNTNPIGKFTDIRAGNAKGIVKEIYDEFEKEMVEYLSHPSCDGSKKRNELRKKLEDKYLNKDK